MNRSMKLCDMTEAELESMFAGPFRSAGYMESVNAVINANNWWPCYAWSVLEFLAANH